MKKIYKYLTSFYSNKIKKFWRWTWDDKSFSSYISAIILSIIIIQFLIFPTLGFFLKNDFPIVTIVSGSMEHKIVGGKICDKKNLGEDRNLDFNLWWDYCGEYYEENFNLTKEKFLEFPNKNGLDIGEVLIIYKKKNEDINVGDNLVFISKDEYFFENFGPVIHRVILKEKIDGKFYFTTKGDHNSISQKNFEDNIGDKNVIGVSILEIPYLGLPKYYLSKILGWI